MRSFRTPLLASVSLSLLLSACSEKSEEAAAPASAPAAEAAADASMAGSATSAESLPDISPISAPGVAFAYRYAFTLPEKNIGEVQQQHAASCERLGASRCQITGMSYNKPEGGSASARLDFLLAPEIAHRFGTDGIAAVERADGKLDEADVTGDDAGGAIDESQERSGALRAQLAQIERRLLREDLSKQERRNLADQAAGLRDQLRGEKQEQNSQAKRLATTPVNFAYASEGVFGASSDPFGKAAATSWGSATVLFTFLLTLLGVALPWAVLAGLIALAWRGFRRSKQAPGVSGAVPALDTQTGSAPAT